LESTGTTGLGKKISPRKTCIVVFKRYVFSHSVINI